METIAAAMSDDVDLVDRLRLKSHAFMGASTLRHAVSATASPSEPVRTPVELPGVRGDPRPRRAGARATSLLGKQSYSINDHRADQFLLMLERIAGLRAALDAHDIAALQRMVCPGGRVHDGLNRQFASPVADYAQAIGYNQVNWLRGAIAVYVAEEEDRRSRAAD